MADVSHPNAARDSEACPGAARPPSFPLGALHANGIRGRGAQR